MIDTNVNLLQAGTIGIIFIFCAREFFAYLRAKKNGETSDKTNKELLGEFKLLNANHLNSINTSIRDGNEKIVRAINDGNTKIIELLGQINGRLDK